ncbi:hypothetical protein FR698_14290 [Pelomicrobium methylotrophicum]|uniref:Uncharacterized protein n=1 Tax=Pelomicrobium methylotrophicum TaxID=2602750 RepID=A0A5C7EEL5_9PROT|nr:hypothetical protein FR698_14290 [Pelomicrobium methylotrophicum]
MGAALRAAFLAGALRAAGFFAAFFFTAVFFAAPFLLLTAISILLSSSQTPPEVLVRAGARCGTAEAPRRFRLHGTACGDG